MIEGSCHCGAINWSFGHHPGTATACNCTICRRYGALWAYDYLGEAITLSGAVETQSRYLRPDATHLGFHFCPTCGCVTHWQARNPDDKGRTRIAVNLRTVTDPSTVADIPIRHFDGLVSWSDTKDRVSHVRSLWP